MRVARRTLLILLTAAGVLMPAAAQAATGHAPLPRPAPPRVVSEATHVHVITTKRLVAAATHYETICTEMSGVQWAEKLCEGVYYNGTCVWGSWVTASPYYTYPSSITESWKGWWNNPGCWYKNPSYMDGGVNFQVRYEVKGVFYSAFHWIRLDNWPNGVIGVRKG